MASVTTAAPARVRPFVDASTMVGDSAALARFAATHGYVFVRGLAPRASVMNVRADVLTCCARRGWLDDRAPQSRGVARSDAASRATESELLALQGEVQWRPAFLALRHDPGILAVVEAVLGATPVPGYGDVCRLAFPNDLERTTPPHQDHFFTRRSTSLWTVWIPLGDCPPALGGLVVMPGSHTNGLLAHDGGTPEAPFIIADEDASWAGRSYRAGDVLMFNALTVHSARPNATADRIRLSADFRFQAS